MPKEFGKPARPRAPRPRVVTPRRPSSRSSSPNGSGAVGPKTKGGFKQSVTPASPKTRVTTKGKSPKAMPRVPKVREPK